MLKFLKKNPYVSIGLMLFALFFGAGNLIFPAFLGQNAGTNLSTAMIGFIIMGVGLPLLGVIVMGYSGAEDLLDLSSRAGKGFGIAFTTLLYLTIGPFFAIPRTGTTTYELGLSSFVAPEHTVVAQAVFLAFFMGLTYSLDDFAVTFFVTGNGFSTIAVEIYSRARQGISLQINALSTLMFLFSLILVIGYYFIQQYQTKRLNQKNAENDLAKGVVL